MDDAIWPVLLGNIAQRIWYLKKLQDQRYQRGLVGERNLHLNYVQA